MHIFRQTYVFLLFAFVLLNDFQSVLTFVDFFLDSNETSTILGYPATLFYTFNGELRQKLISHSLEIPEYKNLIEFTWKTSIPVKNKAMYKFDFIAPENGHHRLSINSTGFIPSTLAKFQLIPDCSAQVYNEFLKQYVVQISLGVNFYLNSSNNVYFLTANQPRKLEFTIHFRKLCSALTSPLQSQIETTKNSDFTIAYIIIASLVCFVLCLVVAVTYMYITNRMRQSSTNHPSSSKYDSMYGETNKAAIYNEGKRVPSANVRSEPGRRKLKVRKRDIQSDEEDNIEDKEGEDANNPNIYESLQDASTSVIVINQLNEKNEFMSTRVNLNKKSRASENHTKLMQLNLTTNTVQSMYNTTATADNISRVSMNTLATTTNTRANGGGTSGSMSRHTYQLNSLDACKKIDKSQIELNEKKQGFMGGMYSSVHDAHFTPSDDEDNKENESKRIRVLVKTLTAKASTEQADTMLRESCLLRGFKHKNLNPLIGVCMGENQLPMAIFPYCEMGNLKKYLLVLKKANAQLNNEPDTIPQIETQLITTQEILYIVLQLLKAVNYLHGKRLIHRDIAARNCWLDKGFALKLADFALARDIFADDYCDNKPVRWMSVESLRKNSFNSRSDIWACGVTIWECFTLASQPYDDMKLDGSSTELLDYLSSSDTNRLARPNNCPKDLFELYNKCWSGDPTARPNLKELFYSMHKYYTTLENYV